MTRVYGTADSRKHGQSFWMGKMKPLLKCLKPAFSPPGVDTVSVVSKSLVEVYGKIAL